MLELKPRPAVGSSQARVAVENSRPKLLLALFLLVIALVGVVAKDWNFWFGSEQVLLDSDSSQPSVAPKKVADAASTKTQPLTPSVKKPVVAKGATEPTPAEAPAVAAIRTVLPPLDVEVVAGDKHSKIHPGTNAAKVEITRPGSVATFAPATNAANREPMTAEAPQAYPALAQHMKVQGSVVLQAIISAEGVVQDIHVLSGPSILAAAARQAVREWRFKPVVQNGQAVETKADITVNFTIKVADSSEGTTLAESRASEMLTITR
jgi:TonB family protein